MGYGQKNSASVIQTGCDQWQMGVRRMLTIGDREVSTVLPLIYGLSSFTHSANTYTPDSGLGSRGNCCSPTLSSSFVPLSVWLNFL